MSTALVQIRRKDYLNQIRLWLDRELIDSNDLIELTNEIYAREQMLDAMTDAEVSQ